MLSETADVVYKCSTYYDPATEAGIAFDDPDVGIEWPQDSSCSSPSATATAPTLAEIADELPFTVRAVSAADGRYAPSPTGTLHLGNLRTALLAWLFARSAGGRFLVRMEDLDPGRVRAGLAEQQLEDLRRDRTRLGRAGGVPVARAARSTTDARRAPARGGPAVRVLLHAGRDPRRRVGAARAAAGGRLPRHVPAA